jgi:AcrR family transcriptional regulator
MRRGRAAGYEDQRQMILERSAELFARHGYPATSMNQLAAACGLSKATLYHYYRDKYALLLSITDGHVARLEAVVAGVLRRGLAPEAQMRTLIESVVREYAGAQNAHRVLTDDVRFLDPADCESVLARERAVVRGFAQAVAALRPEAALSNASDAKAIDTPLSMLLFGMINWMFTWVRPDGELDYDEIAVIVADLFLGGLGAVKPPRATGAPAAPPRVEIAPAAAQAD